MPRILFIAAHRPDRSPSQRFRFEQYLPFLESRGYSYQFSYLIDEEDDKKFYQSGSYINKLKVFVKSVLRRWKDLKRAGQFDVIFIQREAFMTGSTYFEKRFARTSAKVIFDFDDAIWLLDVSAANKNLGWLKDPGKTARIIALADQVIAGNDYLADYARQFNTEVRVIPTTIDTDYHQPAQEKPTDAPVVIGWTGTLTTIKHFALAIPILRALKQRFGNRVHFLMIGDGPYAAPEDLALEVVQWQRATEIEDLQRVDIGIMPLPDDEWSKGKCGFKGLQYMALGIPAVLSPVGVNTTIIRHGENGYLARKESDWITVLSRLIDDPELRQRMGTAARQTVEERYSVKANQAHYLKCLEEVLP